MMERQEEEEKSKRLCLSSQATSLPLDLTLEVLIRLPAKSIVRSRCLSKVWSSYTTLAYLNKLFTARSLQSPCLLIFTIQGDSLVGFSLPQHGNSDKSSSSCSVVDSFVIKYPKYCGFKTPNSVHGLYYFPRSGQLVIWNPTMRQFSILTRPERCWKYAKYFIGYDPIDGTYKALSMPPCPNSKPNKKKNSNLPRVLTLGKAQESWRFIQGSFEHVPFPCGQCINGVLYYEAFLKFGSSHRFVMSFHVRSEKFNMLQVPWKLSRGHLLTYQGKLACLVSHTNYAFILLWVLEDVERHEWSFRKFSIPFPLDDPVSQTSLYLSGVTDAGHEFVYVPKTLLSPFHVLYFDPLRNSFRRVIYQGIADEECRRRNGLRNGRLDDLQAFPSHIETLMSL